MTDVFLSYAREDSAVAEDIARLLAEAKLTVWWDRRLRPHQGFRAAIQEQLDTAKCVIVVWSTHSLNSEFVIDEAATALKAKRLIQVRIEKVSAPLGFRQGQVADLSSGVSADNPNWRAVLESIEILANTRLEKPPEPVRAAGPKVSKTAWSKGAGIAAGVALVAITAVAVTQIFQPREPAAQNGDISPALSIPIEQGLSQKEIDGRVLRCDKLAAHHLDDTRPTGIDGMTIDQLEGHAGEAARICRSAIAANPSDKTTLSRMYFNLGRALFAERQIATGMVYTDRAAKMLHRRAVMSMGLRYLEGDGGVQDFLKARDYFQQADRLGEATARASLGQYASVGLEEPVDKAKAFRIWTESARVGYNRSQYNLGVAFRRGIGTSVDNVAAYGAFMDAIKYKPEITPLAHTQLGWMSENGIGTEKNPELAIKRYRDGRSYNHNLASLGLAKLYGTGAPRLDQDLDAATTYVEEALANENNTVNRDAYWMYERNEDFSDLVRDAIEKLSKVAQEKKHKPLTLAVERLKADFRQRKIPRYEDILCSRPDDIKRIEWCSGYWEDKPPP